MQLCSNGLVCKGTGFWPEFMIKLRIKVHAGSALGILNFALLILKKKVLWRKV